MATFTAGTSFTDGVTGDVTAAKLNALVANATPLSNFITDRTAETSIATDDLVLISDTSESGALNKMTVANFTNIVSTGTGTAADPAIRPTGDTNTGIFFPAADTIAFSEGGTEAMRIDSSGNVGIGTTTPTAKLDVNGEIRTSSNIIRGTGSDLLYVVGGSSNNNNNIYIGGGSASTPNTVAITTTGTERLRIDSSGNVGIGTTSPATKLDIAGSIRVSDGNGLQWGNAGNYISGSGASNVVLLATNSTERIRIDSSGNVGVGTSSPSYRMSVDTSAQQILSCNSTDANGGYATFLRSGTAKGFIGSAQPLVSGGSNNDFAIRAENNLVFATNTNTERLRITSGGNVEIGATGKSAKLLVQSEAGNSQCVYFIHDTALEDVLSLASTPTSGNNMFIQFYTEANAATSRGYIDYNRGSSVVRYSTTSDETLKNIIGDSSGEESVNILKNTKIRDFTWKSDTTNKVNVGVIAQELYNVFKGAVSVGGDIVKKDSDGNDVTTYQPWGVDKTAFTFHLVAGWQAHEKLIQELKSENDSLKNRITALEAA